jgi:hypothetical protein
VKSTVSSSHPGQTQGGLKGILSTGGMVSSHLSVVALSHSPAPGGPLSCIAPHMDLRVGANCTPGME